MATPPTWVQDAVFYHIFVDRFARGASAPEWPHLERWEDPPTAQGFKGGDLWGIAERLGDLQALGVTALVLTPIFASASNHRYHTDDYHRVDPLLGGDAALRHLLDAAHARGMRVVLDGVFNHCGRGLFPFHHLTECQEASPYRDWFKVHAFPVRPFDEGRPPTYSAWWNLHALPKFNHANPAVRDFIYGVATRWLDFGIDGWRLDVPQEISDKGFWEAFCARCRAVNPEAYIVGEIWTSPRGWVGPGRFDAQMNYPLGRVLLGWIGQGNQDRDAMGASGYGRVPAMDAPQAALEIAALWARLPPAYARAQLGVLGSHDTPRIRTILGEDRRLPLLLLAQATLPGPPNLYYGDELGLEGAREPASRGAYPRGMPSPFAAALKAQVQALLALRHAHPALRRGDLHLLKAGSLALAFARTLGDARLLVALNPGDAPETLELPAGWALGAPALTVSPGAPPRAAGASLTLPPFSGGCWVLGG